MAALRRSRVHKQIMERKRLRDEDFGYEESIQYASRKGDFCWERKLDEYNRPLAGEC